MSVRSRLSDDSVDWIDRNTFGDSAQFTHVTQDDTLPVDHHGNFDPKADPPPRGGGTSINVYGGRRDSVDNGGAGGGGRFLGDDDDSGQGRPLSSGSVHFLNSTGASAPSLAGTVPRAHPGGGGGRGASLFSGERGVGGDGRSRDAGHLRIMRPTDIYLQKFTPLVQPHDVPGHRRLRFHISGGNVASGEFRVWGLWFGV
jgi:hypothetical protein